MPSNRDEIDVLPLTNGRQQWVVANLRSHESGPSDFPFLCKSSLLPAKTNKILSGVSDWRKSFWASWGVLVFSCRDASRAAIQKANGCSPAVVVAQDVA